MKITFLLSTFPKISETFILSQITGLIDLGVEVEIIAFKQADTEKIHPLVEQYQLLNKTVYVSSKNKLVRGMKLAKIMLLHPKATINLLDKRRNHRTTGLRSLELSKYVKKLSSTDVIIAHYGPIGATVANLQSVKLLDPVKLITFFHGFDVTAYQQLFSQKNIILTISEFFQEKLLKLEVKSNQVAVCHMGVDISLFKYQPHEIQSPTKLVSVGRLVEKKGFDTTIEMVHKLVSEGNNIHLNIIGDGPLKEELGKKIIELNLQEHITLLGSQNQKQVHQQMLESDFFILMSHTSSNGDKEGIPVVLMEAMASGLPVISTYHSGIPELITNNKSGWLVPENDAQAGFEVFRNAIKNVTELNEVKSNARKKIGKEFNSELLNQQLLELCKKED